MKKAVFALAVCAAAAWLYFTPYLALDRLQRAAEAGDTQALNELVDFPELRGSVRSEVQDAVRRGISEDRGNPFAAIGGMVTGIVVDPVVNAAVTPAGITALLQGRIPGRDGKARENGNWREDVKIARGYEGLNKFVVGYRDRESGDERVALILRREGLQWRLTGVRFGSER